MFVQLARRDVAVCVLSNGWNPLQTLKARRAGFGGDVLASADLGVRKPDPAAFDALAAHLGVPAGCCYYVGDDPKADIAGALQAGLRAVWLDNEGKVYPTDVPPPTHTVPSLAALLDIIGETVTL
jgi:putative hydrolase of the HAD superfamily